jgi:tyrosyl-tRNA synthetase
MSEEIPFAEMESFTSAVDALVDLKLAASKGAARRLVEQGAVSINGRKIASVTDEAGEPVSGSYYLVKKGARDFGLVRVSSGDR